MNRAIVILLAMLVSSCQSLNTRGTYIDDDMVRQISSQKLTREQLVLNIGTPTLEPDYSKDKWYYVSRTLRNKPWAEPKLIKQRIIEVVFDGDIVKEINVLDSKRQKEVKISKDETISKGTEENPVQTFVKNFGRFNKKSHTKRR